MNEQSPSPGPQPAWSQPRTAIVTGGGSGIGLAVARRLADEAVARVQRQLGAPTILVTSAGLGAAGITVNTVPPGFVDTPMLRKTGSRGFLGTGIEAHRTTTPVRRVGRPEDIAAACAYLVREEAGYITGQVIGVNGGRTT